MRKESFVTWQSLTPTVPTVFIYKVQRNLVKLNDSVFLNLVSQDRHGFSYDNSENKEINTGLGEQTVIKFELSRAQLRYHRTVDTVFDFTA